jgi:phospholipase/carboxylesterase
MSSERPAGSDPLDFTHEYIAGSSPRTLLLLHGTGGSERDLLPFGRALDPAASLLSPRGKILEHGTTPRFFRRLAEGVFDVPDLIHRTHELADFSEAAAAHYGFDSRKLIAVGYSNGANIAASVLLLRPKAFGGAALLRAMVPLVPETLPDLAGTAVLVLGGKHDPIVLPENTRELIGLLQRAGGQVTAQFEEAGHGLTAQTAALTKQWLDGLS